MRASGDLSALPISRRTLPRTGAGGPVPAAGVGAARALDAHARTARWARVSGDSGACADLWGPVQGGAGAAEGRGGVRRESETESEPPRLAELPPV